jgi:hypothetical protein
VQYEKLPLDDPVEDIRITLRAVYGRLQPPLALGIGERAFRLSGGGPVGRAVRGGHIGEPPQSLEVLETSAATLRIPGVVRLQEHAPGGGSQGPRIIVMLEPGPTLARVELELALLERLAVCMRQRADVHPERPARLRADVEKIRVVAEWTVRQQVVPPAILLRGRHVVRHDIEQDLEAPEARGADERRPCLFAAQILADAGGIRDVVAMHAARHRLQTG